MDIFRAAAAWVKANADEDFPSSVEECSDILSEVRLSLIPTQDLLKVVRPTNLVQPDILLDAIQARTEYRDMELKYRGFLCKLPTSILDTIQDFFSNFRIKWQLN